MSELSWRKESPRTWRLRLAGRTVGVLTLARSGEFVLRMRTERGLWGPAGCVTKHLLRAQAKEEAERYMREVYDEDTFFGVVDL